MKQPKPKHPNIKFKLSLLIYAVVLSLTRMNLVSAAGDPVPPGGGENGEDEPAITILAENIYVRTFQESL